MTDKTVVRAALYARISNDGTGAGLGVSRQRDEMLKLCERDGLTVVHEFADNDISASTGKRRPGYEALLAAVENGEVDVVVVYATDRLYRRMIDLIRITGILGPRHVVVRAVLESDVNLSTADGIMQAQIRGSVAEHETRRKSERIRSQKAQRRSEGRRLGGRVTWGFTKVDGMVVPDPELEPVILDLYRRYVAGEGVPSLARDLNARGLLSPGGPGGSRPRSSTAEREALAMATAPLPTAEDWRDRRRGWTTTGLQGWMDRCAAFARAQDSEGRWIETPDRLPVSGCDEALFQAYLAERSRRQRRGAPKSRVAQWMLGGLLVCGLCGARMSVNTFSDDTRSRVSCSRQRTGGDCPGGGVSVGRLWIERAVGLALYGPGWAEALLRAASGDAGSGATGESLRAHVAALTERLTELDDRIAAGATARVGLVSSLMSSSLSADRYDDLMKDMDEQARALEATRAEVAAELGSARAREGTLEAISAGTVGRTEMIGALADALAGEHVDDSAVEAALASTTSGDMARYNRLLSEVIARVVVTPKEVRLIPTALAVSSGAAPLDLKRQRRSRVAKRV